jgi:hypothetical protein
VTSAAHDEKIEAPFVCQRRDRLRGVADGLDELGLDRLLLEESTNRPKDVFGSPAPAKAAADWDGPSCAALRTRIGCLFARSSRLSAGCR